jgi:hypothetical protein
VQFFKYKWYKYKLNHTQGQWYEYQHWVDHNKTKIILKKKHIFKYFAIIFYKVFWKFMLYRWKFNRIYI